MKIHICPVRDVWHLKVNFFPGRWCLNMLSLQLFLSFSKTQIVWTNKVATSNSFDFMAFWNLSRTGHFCSIICPVRDAWNIKVMISPRTQSPIFLLLERYFLSSKTQIMCENQLVILDSFDFTDHLNLSRTEHFCSFKLQKCKIWINVENVQLC